MTGSGSAAGAPRVSVVIPCFNLGAFLPEAVESVRRQTLAEHELIVVDDGSTDAATVALLDRYERDGLTVLRTANAGPAAARNRGIEAGAAEYVLCVDADDVLLPTFLERTVPELDGSPGVGIVTTHAQVFGARRGGWRTEGYNPVKLLWRNVIASASLFRRACWAEAGGYPERTAADLDGIEDWSFWISIVEHGWSWKLVPEALYRFRLRESSLTAQALGRRGDLLRELVRLHGDSYRTHVAEILVQMDEAMRSEQAWGPRRWAKALLRRF